MGEEIFETRAIAEDDIPTVGAAKILAGKLWDLIENNKCGLPSDRLLALAQTNLEQSIMWFNKGISRSVMPKTKTEDK